MRCATGNYVHTLIITGFIIRKLIGRRLYFVINLKNAPPISVIFIHQCCVDWKWYFLLNILKLPFYYHFTFCTQVREVRARAQCGWPHIAVLFSVYVDRIRHTSPWTCSNSRVILPKPPPALLRILTIFLVSARGDCYISAIFLLLCIYCHRSMVLYMMCVLCICCFFAYLLYVLFVIGLLSFCMCVCVHAFLLGKHPSAMQGRPYSLLVPPQILNNKYKVA